MSKFHWAVTLYCTFVASYLYGAIAAHDGIWTVVGLLTASVAVGLAIAGLAIGGYLLDK